MKKTVRKFFALLTALMLLCTLVPLALAADVTPPLYQSSGYDSTEDYMASEWGYMGESWLTYDWVSTRFASHYSEITANPQLALEDYGMADLAELDSYVENGDWASRDAFYRDAAISLIYDDIYSYVPPLSVQLNGKTVGFPDAQPEVRDGRTMVPFRPMAEAMGYQVSYGANAVTAAANGNSVRFTIGKNACAVQAKGEAAPRTVSMDIAPYMKNGRTYVPVRFFAEALGMSAAWDSTRNAAVVYDAAALIETVDRQFTVVNNWLKAQPQMDESKAVRTAMSVALTYTELNSIDGNATYPIDGTLEVVSEGESFRLAIKCDLYEIVRLMTERDGGDASALQLVSAMKDSLKNASLELIYDADADILYIRCPMLVKVLSGYFGGSLSPATLLAADATWIKVEGAMGDLLASTGLPATAQMQLSDRASVGAVILYAAEQSNQYTPGAIYNETLENANNAAMLLGDHAFRQNGTRYTAVFDAKGAYDGTEIEEALRNMDVGYLKGSILLDTATGAAKADLEARSDSYYSDTLVKIALDTTGGNGTMKLTVHEKNESILELSLRFTQESGVASPAKQPPAGSIVVDAESLMTSVMNSFGSFDQGENAA